MNDATEYESSDSPGLLSARKGKVAEGIVERDVISFAWSSLRLPYIAQLGRVLSFHVQRISCVTTCARRGEVNFPTSRRNGSPGTAMLTLSPFVTWEEWSRPRRPNASEHSWNRTW